MPIIRALATFNHSSGVPENVTTNTLYFDAVADPVTGALPIADIIDAVREFYVTPTGNGSTVSLLMSSNMSNPWTIRLYNLSDPEPRSPIGSSAEVTLGTGPGAFPAEVSLVLSFRSAQQSGVPIARRRGRIYIGPLSDQAALIDRSGGDVRPSAQARTTLAQAAARLMGDPSTTWCTRSTIDGAASPVLAGFVDNAYDTQRRRGTAATARTNWP